MKVIKFVEKNLKWIILFISVILVISIAEDVLDQEIMEADMI